MRLICPNCGAQYEVADDVIPQGGRDVQCSNCGHAWFEGPAGGGEEEPPLASAPDYDEPAEDPVVHNDDSAAPPVHDEPGPEPEPEPEAEPVQERGSQRSLDPDVTDILREEAEREAAARRAEALESQPDLGLTEADPPSRRQIEAQQRMARLKGETPEPAPDPTAAATSAAAAASSRRDLLPDIDEINSTLRSESERADEAAQAPLDTSETRKRRGFRRGFFLVVVIAVAAALVYAYAPQISEQVPQLAEPLARYVEQVDAARLWLDLKVQGLVEMLNDAAVADAEARDDSADQ